MCEKLVEFLIECGYDGGNIDQPLRNYVSSLDIVELMCYIEDTYNILIPDEEACRFGDSLRSVTDYAEQLRHDCSH